MGRQDPAKSITIEESNLTFGNEVSAFYSGLKSVLTHKKAEDQQSFPDALAPPEQERAERPSIPEARFAMTSTLPQVEDISKSTISTQKSNRY